MTDDEKGRSNARTDITCTGIEGNKITIWDLASDPKYVSMVGLAGHGTEDPLGNWNAMVERRELIRFARAILAAHRDTTV